MALKEKVANAAQQAQGHVKEHIGERTGDDNLRADGQADQTEGKLKQVGEDVKDIFR